VADLLHQNGMDVFGATSCGEFIDGHQSEGEIAILLLDISRDSYHIYFEEIGNGSITDAAARIGQNALTTIQKSIHHCLQYRHDCSRCIF
jgi:hypothetical protein